MLYWPTPYTTNPSPTATFDLPLQAVTSPSTFISNNYIFSVHSAYLVYKNAKAVLPYNTESSLTGPFYSSLTVQYPANSLSTYQNCNQASSGGSWPLSPVNYQDFNSPPKWSVVSQQRPCHAWSMSGDSLQAETFPPSQIATQYTDYQNQPIVALPTPLTNIAPAWATCIMGDTGLGLFDPPRAILPADFLVGPGIPVAQTVPGMAPTLAQETAQPAPGLSSNQPAKTSIVMNLPNGDTVVDYPPVGASIQAPSQSVGPSPAQGASNVDALPSAGHNAAGSPLPLDSSNAGDQSAGEAAIAGLNDSSDENAAPVDAPGGNSGSDTNTSAEENVSFKSNPGANIQQGTEEVSAESPPTVAVGGHQIQAAPNGGVIVNGATFNAATPVNTAHGVQVSYGASGVVVGGNTVVVPPAAAGQSAASVSLNGHIVQVSTGSSGNQIAVDGQAIPAGTSQAQIGGNVISVLNNGQISVLPTTLPYIPIAIASNPAETGASFNGAHFSPQPLPNGAVATPDTTLFAGGPDATISGTPVSISPSNRGVLISQSTIQPIPTSPQQLGLIMGGQILTPVGKNAIAFDGSTFSEPGQTFTLENGEIASLEDGAVVAGSQTVAIPSATLQTGGYQTDNFVVDGQSFTPVGNGAVVVQGSTLSASGQSVTLQNGELASLKDGALVVGTQTIPLPTAAPRIGYDVNGVVVGGETFSPVGSIGVAVDGTTLSEPGQSITLPIGEVASLEDGAMVIGSQTLPIPRLPQATGDGVEGAVITGSVETLSNGRIVYDGFTFSDGGSAVTLSDGEVLSLGASVSASAVSSPDVDAAAEETGTSGVTLSSSMMPTHVKNNAAIGASLQQRAGHAVLTILLLAAVMII